MTLWVWIRTTQDAELLQDVPFVLFFFFLICPTEIRPGASASSVVHGWQTDQAMSSRANDLFFLLLILSGLCISEARKAEWNGGAGVWLDPIFAIIFYIISSPSATLVSTSTSSIFGSTFAFTSFALSLCLMVIW
jgi:hypothetical protein